MAERLKRTLLNSARSMLHYAGLPEKFWAEAVFNATHVKNQVPTKAVRGQVPYEAFCGKKPSFGYLRTFGCDAYAHVPKANRKKFDSRSKKVIFLGYDLRSKAYRLWDSEKNQVMISRDVKFNEGNFGEIILHEQSEPEGEAPLELEWNVKPEEKQVNENQTAPETDADETNQSDAQQDTAVGGRRAARQAPAWMRSGEFLVGEELDEQAMSVSAESVGVEPKTVREALNSPSAGKWQEAMQAEYESLVKNNVFKLVKLPEGRDVVDNKWVFKLKRNSDGSVQRYKARLVARGFSQQPGVDFTEILTCDATHISACNTGYCKSARYGDTSDRCTNSIFEWTHR